MTEREDDGLGCQPIGCDAGVHVVGCRWAVVADCSVGWLLAELERRAHSVPLTEDLWYTTRDLQKRLPPHTLDWKPNERP